MNRRNIEIDLEIHKLLELNRKHFDETECDILRRVFVHKASPENISNGSSPLPRATMASEVSGLDLHLQKVSRLPK